MASEWLKVMLEEITRKRDERERARVEETERSRESIEGAERSRERAAPPAAQPRQDSGPGHE